MFKVVKVAPFGRCSRGCGGAPFFSRASCEPNVRYAWMWLDSEPKNPSATPPINGARGAVPDGLVPVGPTDARVPPPQWTGIQLELSRQGSVNRELHREISRASTAGHARQQPTMNITPAAASLLRLSAGLSRVTVRHGSHLARYKKPQPEKSGFWPGHGEKIWVFNNIVTGQVVYSTRPVLDVGSSSLCHCLAGSRSCRC